MKKIIILSTLFLSTCTCSLKCQPLSDPANWKTWFISSVKDYRIAPPSKSRTSEKEIILSMQQSLDETTKKQISYWNAGSTGYRWYEMMNKLWLTDTSHHGALANVLLNVGIYDATIAAWDNKDRFNSKRPFDDDKRIKLIGVKPGSSSYPCEHSVAAGLASTVIAHFFPKLADSVKRMAEQQMNSRVAAGYSYPSDTEAGFALGKKIAEDEIRRMMPYSNAIPWNGQRPNHPGVWKGSRPTYVMAAKNKTIVLDSASQYRPGPPPDFAKDMMELKNAKPNFRSLSNAFLYGSQDVWGDMLNKKVFEHNLHLDAPAAARVFAVVSIGIYDGFVSCWDAKYTYWGQRPNQYDTSYVPPLLVTPSFPGYPSGHAAISAVNAEIFSYFFPADAAMFHRKAKETAESRFQAGIHFRSDNEVALVLGKKVGQKVVEKLVQGGY